MNGGQSGNNHDPALDRLRQQFPRWRIWRGRATGDYWALPPRDNPAFRELISADDIGELAHLLARAEGRRDR